MKKEKTSYLPIKGTHIWDELKKIILNQLNTQPVGENNILTISENDLLILFEKEFNHNYNPIELIRLLRNGFEIRDSQFQFKREDFIRPKAQL